MHEDADRVIPLGPAGPERRPRSASCAESPSPPGSTMGDKDTSVFHVLADLVTDRHESKNLSASRPPRPFADSGACDALALLRTVAHDQSAALRKVVEEAILYDKAASKKQ